MRRSFLALSLGLLSLSPALADPRPYLDLDFEAPECSAGWVEDPYFADFEARPDSSIYSSGQQSLRIQARRAPSGFAYGSTVQQFPTADAAGKRIRLSGFIRTENVTGYAGLAWVSINSDGGFSIAEMSASGPVGTTPWTSYAIELDIPANARTLFFGVEVFGTGTAWFDGLGIEIDGRTWRDGHLHLPEPSPGAINWVSNRAIPLSTVPHPFPSGGTGAAYSTAEELLTFLAPGPDSSGSESLSIATATRSNGPCNSRSTSRSSLQAASRNPSYPRGERADPVIPETASRAS